MSTGGATDAFARHVVPVFPVAHESRPTSPSCACASATMVAAPWCWSSATGAERHDLRVR